LRNDKIFSGLTTFEARKLVPVPNKKEKRKGDENIEIY
jgi:hypothetical protein